MESLGAILSCEVKTREKNKVPRKKNSTGSKNGLGTPKTNTFCVFLVKEKIVLVFEAIQANLRAPEFFLRPILRKLQ